jgi:DNA-binding PadR family transcriptional regulator
MTGKQIINEATTRSEGTWTPSPGLIYPLLGRLLRDNLIEETDDGKFTITPQGTQALQQHTKYRNQLDKQINLLTKLGLTMYTTTKLAAEESMDRIQGVTHTMKLRISQSSTELQDRFYTKYKTFLLSELTKIEEKDTPPQEP